MASMYPPMPSSLVLLADSVDSATLLADTIRRGAAARAAGVLDGVQYDADPRG